MSMRAVGFVGLVGVSLLVGACGVDRSSRDEGVDAPEARAARAQPAAARPTQVTLQLDQANKLLERGGDANAALATFEGIAANDQATLEEKDEARLGVSAAREALGDKDGAVEAIEELLQSHGDSGRFDGRDVAEKRLRKLLTGSETGTDKWSPSERYAPSAKALAPYFKPDAKNQTLVDIYAFGDQGGTRADELGIFNIPGAKRDLFRETCPLCEGGLDIGRSFTRSGSWTAIPRAMGEAPADMPQIDRSLLVFYFDLGDDRVPERYDEYLPIPSAEIVKHLEKGEGLIAFRERPNAKPTLVIAAPRVGQLDAVQEVFAQLTAMPTTPLSVPLSVALKPDEIQSVVRASRKEMRACYETLLKSDAKAAGSVVFEFSIAPDGSVVSATINDTKSTLRDPALWACTTDVVKSLKFPATNGEVVKVAYPMAFSPN